MTLSIIMLSTLRCNRVDILEILLNAGAEIDRSSPKMDSALACAAHTSRFGAVQLLANKGAKVMSIAADGTQYNAIEAPKNYLQIQQWLRDFYQDANSAVDA